MKKIILFILLAISLAPAYAQTSVGIVGGYNLSSGNLESNWEGWHYKVSSRSGWRAGLIADQPLSKKFYLQPQLMLNQKGYNYSPIIDIPNNPYYKYKRQLLYLELQAHLLYKLQIGNGKLFLGAGPYIGRGISGRERIESYQLGQDGQPFIYPEYNIIKYKKPSSSELDVTYIKPYDVGLNLLAGYELKNGLFFNAIYSFGFNNNNRYDAYKSYNGYLGITIGYFLKKFS